MAKLLIYPLALAGLGFAYRRYQDRLPPWARVQTKKNVDGQASVQQPHKKKQLKQVNGAAQDNISEDIKSLDLQHIKHIFEKSTEAAEASSSTQITPLQPGDVKCIDNVSDGEEMRWIRAGFKLIAQGKLGVILLAGGQGTRLGSSAPKGCYDIGLPSRKSLFQLFAERIARVQKLAAEGVPKDILTRKPIRWYIMTSAATDADTRGFFRQRSFFGLDESQIVFFQQGTLPCLTEQGEVILESPSSVARAPDGNGGLYTALQREGILQDMEEHGVECLDCVSVDNALVRIADPLFAGFCYEQQAECGARVLSKAYPEERVGVFARKNGKVEVVEYSELDPKEAAATFDSDAGGSKADNGKQAKKSWSMFGRQSKAQLKYNWSNVCMHYFTRDFLALAADHVRSEGVYHIAKKKIPSKDGPVQGIKLELFIFDTFPLAERVALLEVHRHEEFAPVKNAPGSASDSPDTARQAILKLHTKLVNRAGGRIRLPKGCEGLEVSPTMSYSGEGLRAICRGRTFRQAHDVFLQGLVPDKALSRELNQARRTDLRTPGATPLVTPGMTPSGSPRGSAPSTPFRK